MSMNNVQGICFVFGFFVFLLFFVFCVVFLTWFKARTILFGFGCFLSLFCILWGFYVMLLGACLCIDVWGVLRVVFLCYS